MVDHALLNRAEKRRSEGSRQEQKASQMSLGGGIVSGSTQSIKVRFGSEASTATDADFESVLKNDVERAFFLCRAWNLQSF